MSGYEPQSQQHIVQQTSASTPSTALLGPSSIPHLSPSTPSGNSPQFDPYCAALKTPIPMSDHPNCKLKPNLAAGHGKAILRKDLKNGHQINMIFEDIHSDFYRSEEHTSELQSHLNLVCRL